MAGGIGGELAKRPLHFIWIVDCSGSMQGKKIESLNFAIHETIQPMKDLAAEHPNAEIFMRAIKFSDHAQWHIAQPTPIDQFRWSDLQADGVTDMGEALTMVAEALQPNNMPERGLPPVLVLLTDGQPTDDFGTGLRKLLEQPWGKRSVRIGIGIGDDTDLETLQKFIGHPEIKPLLATNAAQLTRFIKWASTVPVLAAVNPASQAKGAAPGALPPIPMPPDPDPNAIVADPNAVPAPAGSAPLMDPDIF